MAIKVPSQLSPATRGVRAGCCLGPVHRASRAAGYDSPRLGPQARQAITSAQGVHVSAATVWELTIKSMLGKLTVPHDLSKKLPGQGVELLSVTAEHTEAIREFPELIRHDPFEPGAGQSAKGGSSRRSPRTG